ncbi:MAG: 30S ribosomal protein S17 [Candidatus Chisholmbacteria bacterium]|nr:30S ribosomal protein S17 [Candidatus Chisholmbacteria bacterium]
MKQFSGKVIKKNVPKAVVVKVDSFVEHPIYKKRVKRSQKYLVHDEMGAKVGNIVTFKEVRPISKKKKFKITAIVDKNQ